VADSFYFVRQPLAGNGSITVRISSLTGLLPPANPGPVATGTRPGLVPWAKAGIIIKESTRPGSAYAAMMVTADHGVHMQDNYTYDTAGQPGAVSATSARWLRLTRSGDVITGYDSADGTHWTQVGTVHLAGLSPTVQAGLFAAFGLELIYNTEDHQVTIYATSTPSTPHTLVEIIASSEPPTAPAVPGGLALSPQHPRMWVECQ